MPPTSTDPKLAEGFFEAYQEHSRVLRTWLVAYGIGAPVLLLTNETLVNRLGASLRSDVIAGLFLGGVVTQVLLAALNKTIMWACYYVEMNPESRSERRFAIADWISRQFLIDFIADVATLLLFAAATWMVFNTLTGAST